MHCRGVDHEELKIRVDDTLTVERFVRTDGSLFTDPIDDINRYRKQERVESIFALSDL